MTKKELKSGVRALGLTVEETARKLGISKSWLSKMMSEKSSEKVSSTVAAKIAELITGVSIMPVWSRCYYCGGYLLRHSKRPGGGVIVLHRCPAVDGVTIKIVSEQIGFSIQQAEAALGRRPEKAKGGC